MKVKVNDEILVTTGKDRGKTGRILRTDRVKNKIVVEGVNTVKKHVKPQGDNPGGIIPHDAPINASNVAIICPNCNKTTRVTYNVTKTGVKERICKHCKQALDNAIT